MTKKPTRPYENGVCNHRLAYGGKVWRIDAKARYRADGSVVFAVYRVDGDVTTPLLHKALKAEADRCANSAIADEGEE